MNIPEKINKLKASKEAIKDAIESTGQDANVGIENYGTLIRNIPDSGAISHSQIDTLTQLAIDINGERA